VAVDEVFMLDTVLQNIYSLTKVPQDHQRQYWAAKDVKEMLQLYLDKFDLNAKQGMIKLDLAIVRLLPEMPPLGTEEVKRQDLFGR